MTDIYEIAEYTLKALKNCGADAAQCIVGRSKKDELNVDGGKFSLMRSTFNTSISMKAIKDGKKGVVRDPAVHLEVLEHFLEHAKESHFTVLGLTYSPIRGPEGNIEYLGYLSRAEEEPPVHDLKALVEASHAALEEKKGENDA